MKKYNKQKGDLGETLAADYLKEKGHLLLAQNYKKKTGEIDLITQADETIVFTEVKLRQTTAFGTPAQAVDYKRQQRLIKTALWYLQENNRFQYNVRFDVIELIRQKSGSYALNHIENAFLMEG